MSLGSKRVIFRIPKKLNEEMLLAVLQRNTFSREEPWTISRFMLVAIREKLDKMERSRSGRGRRISATPGEDKPS